MYCCCLSKYNNIQTSVLDENWLQSLLIFVTGLDVIPPLGFSAMPTMTFRHPDAKEPNDPRSELPTANTCSNALSIPVVPTYDQFYANMLAAITYATTFTDI